MFSRAQNVKISQNIEISIFPSKYFLLDAAVCGEVKNALYGNLLTD
jgi:hypothetical protein